MRNLIFLSLLAFAAPSHAENPAPAAGYWEGIATLKTTFLEFKKTITKTRKFYGISMGQFVCYPLDAPLSGGHFGQNELDDGDSGLGLEIVENFGTTLGDLQVVSFKTNRSGEMVSFKFVDSGGDDSISQVLTIQATLKKASPQ